MDIEPSQMVAIVIYSIDQNYSEAPSSYLLEEQLQCTDINLFLIQLYSMVQLLRAGN